MHTIDLRCGASFLDRYEIREHLGTGAFATVVRVYDRTLRSGAFAAKILHPHLSHDPQLRARFIRESRVLEQLQHPFVVRIFDSGEAAGGMLYILMELVEGETLQQRLERSGPQCREECVRLLQAVFEGLAAVHAAKIVHRDLKPSNILLGHEGEIKIADFGVCAPLAAAPGLTVAGEQLGTTAYMAPELLRGEPPTPAADMFSLGCVAYEIAAGELPFAQPGSIDPETRRCLPAAVCKRLLLEGLSEWYAATVAACLEFEPENRPASGQSPATISVSLPEHRASAQKRSRSKKRLIMIAGLSTAFLAVFLYYSIKHTVLRGIFLPHMLRLERAVGLDLAALRGLVHPELGIYSSRPEAIFDVLDRQFRPTYHRRVEFIDLLLESGISPNIVNDSGEPALIHSLRTGSGLSDRLLMHGAKACVTSRNGRSALEAAILQDDIPYLPQYLLQRMAEEGCADWVNRPGSDGVLPLERAIAARNAPLIDLLVRSGAAVLPAKGRSPLHFAAESAPIEIFRRVYRHAGAVPDAHDEKGRTLLAAARSRANAPVVELLLQEGAR